MKILGIGNAIVDVICKVDDNFITKNNLTKSTMKLFFDENEFKNLLNNLKIEKVKNWELQNITNNSIFITNPKTLQDLLIKIVKRGVNTKAYRFTFNNDKEAKFFITSSSDCKVSMARIIQRNKLNQIKALVELSNDLQNVKKIEFINPKVLM